MAKKTSNPYISIVVFSRNDGYGGKRHESSLHGMLGQAERHQLRMELILVEYNPPPDTPLLKDAFPWPEKTKFCTVRSLIVPSSIHETFEFSDIYPVNGAVAYNAGIRRARGDFVLLTTLDILFSDETMEFLASEKLEKDSMYRMSINDVGSKVAFITDLDSQLAACRKAYPSISTATPCDYGSREKPVLTSKGRGDFILLSRERWHMLHGMPEIGITANHCDSLVAYMAYISGAKDIVLQEPMRAYHIDHTPRRGGKVKIFRLMEAIYRLLKLPAPLAHGLGILFYYPLKRLFPAKNKLDTDGVAQLDAEGYQAIVIDMIQGRKSYIFNGDDWGLGKELLEEYYTRVAEWDNGYERN